ncbi:MAG: alpha/beta fold hydrolase [Myxococcota bacterium]
MPHKYVQIEGVATYLHHRGPTTLPEAAPEAARGEVVVALHDVGANGAHFDELLDALCGRHSPMAFDQPGHGRSGGLDSLGDVVAMADFALNLVRKLGLRPVVWLGEGLGAAVALEAARLGPESTRAVVLCSPPAAGAVTAEAIAALDRVVAGRDRRQFDTSGFAEGTSRAVFGRAFGEWLKTDPRVSVGDLRALAAWNGDDALSALDGPCLVVRGEADAGSGAEAVAARVRGAEAVSLPGVGRHLALEAPQELASAVDDFLARTFGEASS